MEEPAGSGAKITLLLTSPCGTESLLQIIRDMLNRQCRWFLSAWRPWMRLG